MAKFSDIYNHDKTAAEEGIWTPIGNGFKVKVRSFESAHTKALRKKLQEPFASVLRLGKEIPDDDATEINVKLVAHSSLLDWNLEDDTGPIPFSPDTAEQLLREQPRFARDVIAVLIADETFKKVNREEDAKNS
jgi:hypothetical protein